MLANPRGLPPRKDLRLTCWVKSAGGEAVWVTILKHCWFFFLIQYNLVLEELLQEQYGRASGGGEARG